MMTRIAESRLTERGSAGVLAGPIIELSTLAGQGMTELLDPGRMAQARIGLMLVVLTAGLSSCALYCACSLVR